MKHKTVIIRFNLIGDETKDYDKGCVHDFIDYNQIVENTLNLTNSAHLFFTRMPTVENWFILVLLKYLLL